jgi:archaellum component FlaC
MNYFERDYEAQIETRELLTGMLNYLQKQNSVLEALSVKVDNLTEFARKYENYNKENAETLIEGFTSRPEELDKLEEVCTYVEEGLSCIEADLAYNTGQIKMQEEKLNRLESHAKAHWGYPY